jgi:hypothetical protein
VSERPREKVIPVQAGYYSVVSSSTGGSSNSNQMRPVVAIAERAEGDYRACILDADGRLTWAGVVHPEPESHLHKSAMHNIHEIAQALKNMLAVAQERFRK